MTDIFNNPELKKNILFNIRTIIILLLLVEFSCTFMFKILNTTEENEKGIYFSPYMKEKQIHVLYKLGIIKSERNTWENGYDSCFSQRYKSKDFNYAVSYNSEGLRGKLVKNKKEFNEFRIITLGDSFVEGYGTNEDSTFPKLLETYLQSENNKTTVINGGICGSNPYYELKLYKNKLEFYNPNLVIIVVNDLDLIDFSRIGLQGKIQFQEYFYAISHIYRAIDALLYLNKQTRLILSNTMTENLTKMINMLILFKEDLKKENRELLIVYLPLQSEVLSGKNGLLKTGLLNRKINFLDLQKEYRKELSINNNSPNIYYWKNDGHHTPIGYDLMAKSVAKKIKE